MHRPSKALLYYSAYKCKRHVVSMLVFKRFLYFRTERYLLHFRLSIDMFHPADLFALFFLTRATVEVHHFFLSNTPHFRRSLRHFQLLQQS